MARKGKGLVFFLLLFFFLERGWKTSYRGGLEGVWDSETSGGCSPVDLFVYLLIVSEREPAPCLPARPDSQGPYRQVLPLCSVSLGKRCHILQGRLLLLLQASLSPQLPSADTKWTGAGRSVLIPRAFLSLGLQAFAQRSHWRLVLKGGLIFLFLKWTKTGNKTFVETSNQLEFASNSIPVVISDLCVCLWWKLGLGKKKKSEILFFKAKTLRKKKTLPFS